MWRPEMRVRLRRTRKGQRVGEESEKPMKKVLLGVVVLFLFGEGSLWAQLQVRAYIWGEVKNAGEYYVPSGANVIELISKAGGPTEYADIGNIKITHKKGSPNRVIKIDLSDYLEKGNPRPLPILENGDVVRVPSNRWHKYRTLIRVVADIAIIANVYYWLTRARD